MDVRRGSNSAFTERLLGDVDLGMVDAVARCPVPMRAGGRAASTAAPCSAGGTGGGGSHAAGPPTTTTRCPARVIACTSSTALPATRRERSASIASSTRSQGPRHPIWGSSWPSRQQRHQVAEIGSEVRSDRERLHARATRQVAQLLEVDRGRLQRGHPDAHCVPAGCEPAEALGQQRAADVVDREARPGPAPRRARPTTWSAPSLAQALGARRAADQAMTRAPARDGELDREAPDAARCPADQHGPAEHGTRARGSPAAPSPPPRVRPPPPRIQPPRAAPAVRRRRLRQPRPRARPTERDHPRPAGSPSRPRRRRRRSRRHPSPTSRRAWRDRRGTRPRRSSARSPTRS